MGTWRSVAKWVLPLLLAACGGGGGGADGGDAGGGTPVAPPASLPVIVVPPGDVSVVAGSTARFAVSATGTGLQYQWRRNGTVVSGATAAAYTTAATTLADDGAVYAVLVSNAAGSVAGGSATLRVTAPPTGGGDTGTRYLEAWSSADSTEATGSLSLGVVDPADPGVLLPVDTLPGVPYSGGSGPIGSANQVVRVRGGRYDAASGEVDGYGLEHLVYIKAGAVWKLRLAKGSGVPVPARLSTESNAGTLTLCAQNLAGTEALVCVYTKDRLPALHFVRLSMAPGDAPLTEAPGYAEELAGGAVLPGFPSGWLNDPATGDISALLWSGLGRRLFTTDLAFAGATTRFKATNAMIPLHSAPLPGGEGRMRQGFFFYADGALRRYDPARQDVSSAFDGLTEAPIWSRADGDTLYFIGKTAAGTRLYKVADARDAQASLLSAEPFVASATGFQITDDHLVFASGTQAGHAVRKSDGQSSTLPLPAAAVLFMWIADQTPRARGNRVYYTSLGSSVTSPVNIVGSLRADGTDRVELTGALWTTVGSYAARLPGHLAVKPMQQGVYTRALITGVGGTRWLDLASGSAGPVLGDIAISAMFGAPYYGMSVEFTATGVLGRAATVQDGSRLVQKLDAWYVGETAGSVRRLTSFLSP